VGHPANSRDKEETVKGFRDFLNQGNVVQLAVAFVIGGAFATVVAALVADVVNPIIAILFAKPNLDGLVLTVNGSIIKYGSFLTAVIAFLLIAAGVYFFFVVPYNRLQARTRSAAPAESNTRACPECLSIIPKAAHRCSFCTAAVEPAAA
jgi:large conductance mechanosensitive channel